MPTLDSFPIVSSDSIFHLEIQQRVTFVIIIMLNSISGMQKRFSSIPFIHFALEVFDRIVLWISQHPVYNISFFFWYLTSTHTSR